MSELYLFLHFRGITVFSLFLLPILALGIGLVFSGNDSGETHDDAPEPDIDVTVADDDPNIIDAGDGNDRVFTNEGDDSVMGGAGDDALFLGDGEDTTISPEDITDLAFGLYSPVEGMFSALDFSGDEGNDQIYGGDGADLLIDLEGSNTIYGGLGHDAIVAFDNGLNDDPDQLFGGFGDDYVLGDRGDSLTGGAGEFDTFGVYVDALDATFVTIEDFQQDEYIAIISETATVNSVLATTQPADGAGVFITVDDQPVAFVKGIDALSPFSYGLTPLSTAPQTVTGTSADDLLTGGAGDDLIYAGAGDDFAYGGAGDDRIFLGDGNDISYGEDRPGQPGTDYVDGGNGDDLLWGSGDNDELHGNLGNDMLVGGAGNARLFGGFGNDVLIARDPIGQNPDILDGGAGNDALIGDNGDLMTGGEGNDSFINDLSYEASSSPIIVTDFSPAEDTLLLNFKTGTPDPGFSLALSGDGTATEVRSAGTVSAILQGITPDQLGADNVRITFG